ncbi:hypothetical protein AAZX31_10G198400 [Glycine max]
MEFKNKNNIICIFISYFFTLIDLNILILAIDNNHRKLSKRPTSKDFNTQRKRVRHVTVIPEMIRNTRTINRILYTISKR